MAETALQSLSSNYKAVVLVPALSMSTPKRDATHNVLTAEVQMVTLVDQNGNAVTPGGGGSSAPYQATPLGYQQITTLTAATGLSVPTGSTFAVVSAEGAGVRWRDDGTNPTASVGMPLYAGQSPQQFSGDLTVLKFIQMAPSATLNVSYYE
jgi:hypothetical protein